MRRMVVLEIYVRADCWNCTESQRIIAEVAHEFPQIGLKLLDVDRSNTPQGIFAVPTYVLDGRIISLGNPYRDELRRAIEQAIRRDET